MLDQIEVHLSDLSSFLSRATLLHSSPHLLPAFTPDPAVSLRKFSAQLPGLDLVAVRDAGLVGQEDRELLSQNPEGQLSGCERVMHACRPELGTSRRCEARAKSPASYLEAEAGESRQA